MLMINLMQMYVMMKGFLRTSGNDFGKQTKIFCRRVTEGREQKSVEVKANQVTFQQLFLERISWNVVQDYLHPRAAGTNGGRVS